MVRFLTEFALRPWYGVRTLSTFPLRTYFNKRARREPSGEPANTEKAGTGELAPYRFTDRISLLKTFSKKGVNR